MWHRLLPARDEHPGKMPGPHLALLECLSTKNYRSYQTLAMTQKLTWEDYEDVGLALFERFPDLDPLEVRFTDLLRWICEVDDFVSDPASSTEGKLERIQMAWLEEWQDANA